MKRFILLLNICIYIVFLTNEKLTAQYTIKSHTFGNGIGSMIGGEFTSGSTLGQTLTGHFRRQLIYRARRFLV